MSIIRQIDHLVISGEQPDPVFALLTEGLGLPVSWPIGGNDEFTSGGVYAGNCNLESATFAPGHLLAHPQGAPPAVVGVAFEPEPFADAAVEMDRRGVAHFDFPPADSGHEHAAFGWTNSALLDVSNAPAPFYFLCEYHHDVPAWRRELRTAFDDAKGGRLGVERVDVVTVAAQDAGRAHEVWSRIFAPIEPNEGGVWRAGQGPGLRVVEGERDHIVGLTFAVRDPSSAQTGIAEVDVLGLDIALVAT